jgi:hypothetical protein
VGFHQRYLGFFCTHKQKFQRLYLCSRCSPIACRVQRRTVTSTDIRELRWRLETGSNQNFDLQQDIDAISTAMPAFSMSLDRKPRTSTHCDTDRRQKLRWQLETGSRCNFGLQQDIDILPTVTCIF